MIALTEVADGARSPLERRYITAVERPHGLPKAIRQAKITIGGRYRYLDQSEHARARGPTVQLQPCRRPSPSA